MAEAQLNRSWPDSAPLATVLEAGAVIAGTNSSEKKAANPNELPDVLRARLEQFDGIIDSITRPRPLDLQTLQLDTAFASLYVLERVHSLLLEHESQHTTNSAPPPLLLPLIGTKDMAQLRTHLSLVLNWGIQHLFTRLLPSLPDKPLRSSARSRAGVPPGAQIIDLTAAHEDYVLLFDIVDRLLRIVLPEGPEGSSSTTFVAMTVLSRAFTELVKMCIFLAWLPSDLRGDISSALDHKIYLARLLNGSHPAQSITAVGTIMRQTPKPLYIRKVCRILSTEQLLRPSGIAGLLSSVFGEDASSTEAPLEKLESTSNLLNTVPTNMPPEEYYSIMIPRLLHLLSPAMDKMTPPSHKRAAAFALSRMLTSRKESEGDSTTEIQQRVIHWCMLDSFKPSPRSKPASNGITEISPSEPFTPSPNSPDSLTKAHSTSTSALTLSPSQAVPTLSTILLNTDPSPTLIHTLLQPIAPQLYTLLEYLRSSKTADPMLRETVEGLLGVWAKSERKEVVVEALWEIVEGRGGEWDLDDEGELHVFEWSAGLPSLTLAQLADLQEGKFDSENDENANTLDLHPNPLYFARFLKEMRREDVASAVYLRILDAHVKLCEEGDPLRKLLFFELIMQISSLVGANASKDSPLRRPGVTRTLMFIKMSLDRDASVRASKAVNDGGKEKLSREGLRFVSQSEDGGDGEGEGDSDDEDLAPGLEGVSKREHLSVTAVNLLFALLEEHPDLSPKTVPLLNEIYTQLEPLANSSSDALRPRAREARITLTARLAVSSAFPATKQGVGIGMGTGREKEEGGEEEESPTEKYQRALTLLQDPLLPVRAHGLLLLRELVAPVKAVPRKKKETYKKDREAGGTVSIIQGASIGYPSVDSALIPAIQSIFLQSLQDEDSYIFLNAVQGLAAMVDGFGREVLKGLVDEYARGLEGLGGSVGTMTARDVDLRVRIGEALGQVIRRCGGALGNYVDIIIPRLSAIVRSSHLPTMLRTSAVSLLATAADTNALALSAYMGDLISGMVDLVQVESVKEKTRPAPGARISATGQLKNQNSPNVDVVELSSCSDSQKEPDGRDEMHMGDVDTGTGSDSRRKVGPGPALGTQTQENKPSPSSPFENQKGEKGDKSEVDARVEDSMDAHPTAANARFPPLRRATLHFLSLLLRAEITRAYSSGSQVQVGGAEMRRADSVLGYVSVTDEDGVVRVMAREAAELLQQLRNAVLGL